MIGVRTDERAVSTNVGYALTLGIATILITGLLVAGGTFLERQQEQTTEKELTVVGQQIVADVSAADRLSQTDDTGAVKVRRQYPERILGSSYSVTLVTSGDDRVRLVSTDPAVTVVVDIQTRTPLTAGTVQGGTIEIVYTGGTLVIRNA